MKDSKISSSIRYQIIRFGLLFFSVIIIFRLFQIQVINSSKYKAQAQEQQWQTYPLRAKRGSIFTSDGYPIAKSSTTYTLFADLVQLKDANRTKVEKYLKTRGFNVPQIDNDRLWIKLAEKIELEQKEEVDLMKLPGLYFQEEYDRFYPESKMLFHVLGIVASDEDGNKVGYFGLEQFYNGDLQGQNGFLLQEKTANGGPILWTQPRKVESIDGSDLHLTIDRGVQFIIENKLYEGVQKYGAKSGTIIVVQPSTGQVIALANYPVEGNRNDAIAAVYEPGSVMKAVTVSSAIDSGKVSIDDVYNDTGPRYFSGHKVDNWDGKHHGEETIEEILQHSNNLGAAWIGMRTGGEILMEYFKSFGFGHQTGIDLDGEENGIIYRKSVLRDIEVANASFGQGISVTPMQLVMAFSAIANNGFIMQPYVVSTIDTKNAQVAVSPRIRERPITAGTSTIMVNLLTEAVSGGEAKFFVLKNYKVAGKTGTAQVPVEGGYDENRTNATFVGFFPSYKNFVMLVKLEEPTFPSGYSAETVVPMWMEIANELAGYYGLAPDR